MQNQQQPSIYRQLVENFSKNIDKENKQRRKGYRPLRKPKNYDFSVSGTDWSQYDADFILRSDAVWEKHKLYDVFYTHYKVI